MKSKMRKLKTMENENENAKTVKLVTTKVLAYNPGLTGATAVWR